MNFESCGIPILAVEKNEKDKEKDKKGKQKGGNIIYLGEGARNSVESIDLPEDEHMQQIPNPETERSILYICGCSGSGKSHYTRAYIKEYKKVWPKRDIFLFSALSDDSTLDVLKYVKRIKISDELSELSAIDFANSLCVFDDTYCITNKIHKKLVVGIMHSILQTGRHFGTSLIYTSHAITSGQDTRMILSEAHSITLFPSGVGNRSLKYLLDSYLGLDKVQVKYIKKCKSRWVTVLKTYPMIIVSQQSAVICKNIV